MAAIVVANGLIAFVYTLIANVLVRKAVERRPVVPRWFYWSYAAFFFCGGVSHMLDDVTFWIPVYRLQAAVLGVTAFASLLAAISRHSIRVGREAENARQGN
jgi:hypothetical protein